MYFIATIAGVAILLIGAHAHEKLPGVSLLFHLIGGGLLGYVANVADRTL